MLLGESIQNIPDGRGGCNRHSNLESVHFIHCLPCQPFCTTDLHHQRSPCTATSTSHRPWEALGPATHRTEEDWYLFKDSWPWVTPDWGVRRPLHRRRAPLPVSTHIFPASSSPPAYGQEVRAVGERSHVHFTL